MLTCDVTPGQTSPSKLYLGYGSNLWIDQMNRRCPGNKLVGLGVLKEWKWVISSRGYANVVPSPHDVVYGLVYELGPSDERRLDGHEGVPVSYTKHAKEIKLQLKDGKDKVVAALVYIDEVRLREGKPWKEYIHRMNMGINDARKKGLPEWYIDKYLRKFIPEEEAHQDAATAEVEGEGENETE